MAYDRAHLVVLFLLATGVSLQIARGQTEIDTLEGGPVISKVATHDVRHNRATVSWATDTKGTSQVEYGETPAFGFKTRAWTARPVTTHERVLFGLKPGTEYYFRVRSIDAGGLSFSDTSTFTTPPTNAWKPPVGAPMPAFDPPEAAGPVTHYVGKNIPGKPCSDASHGTPDKPRCSIPATLSKGSVVEVHGGPYFFDSRGVLITGKGTAAQPVFIRGVNDGQGFPVIDLPDPFIVQGDYVVVEYFTFDRATVVTGYNTFNRTVHGTNIVLRYNEVRDHPVFGSLSLYGQDILARDNFIHHNQAGGPSGSDQHGVFVGPGAQRVGVYDNVLSYNTGDGIQFCHGCLNPPQFVFVGRNDAHDNRENGVDLKACKHVVITQNRIHGHKSVATGTPFCFNDKSMCYVEKPTNRSDGSGFIVGSDGQSVDVWAFGNELYDNGRGVRIEDANDPGGVHFIANNIHDNSYIGLAVQSPGSPVIRVIGNTFSGNQFNIKQETGHQSSFFIHHNVFAGGTVTNVDIGPQRRQSVMSDNLLYRKGGKPVGVFWGGPFTFPSSADMALRFPGGKGNIIADPLFVGAGDFHLKAGSPAIDKATLHNAYADFQATFGVSIQFDFDGNPIPAGLAIDFGAFEYQTIP